jgi:hypothetical protein
MSTQPPADSTSSGGTQQTAINHKWRRKMLIFFVVLFGLGIYGLIDAGYVYPRRGYRAAELLERDYLKYLNEAGKLSDTQATIKDPVAELERTRQASTGSDVLIQRWLMQLSYLKKLTPQNTEYPREDFFDGGVSKGGMIESAQSRLDALKNAPHAEPLESYDIPVQWLICAVGLVWGGYILVLLVRVGKKVYTWDPATKSLTLPTGESFTPSDILEIDKRQWHKLYVHLTIKPEHATLGKKVLEFDLLRYVPLEDWILQMERIAFPDDSADSAGQEAAPATETPA